MPPAEHDAYDRNDLGQGACWQLASVDDRNDHKRLMGWWTARLFRGGWHLSDRPERRNVAVSNRPGRRLKRFFIERVDVDADDSTLYLSRGPCRVGFTIGASILRDGAWVPLPIAPLK